MNSRSVVFGVLPLALLTCEVRPTPDCGDGLIASPEQCDDGNTRDGDGCSSVCEVEVLTPECVDLIETENATTSGLLALDDGRVLVSGQITTTGSSPHGWIGAFDSEGTQLWSLDLDDDALVSSMVTQDAGYAAISGSFSGAKIIEFDGAGALTGVTILSELGEQVGTPYAIIDTAAGMLLAGALTENLWLARLGSNGTVETIVNEDHAGFIDKFGHLVRHGDRIGALAKVGIANHSEDDVIHADIEDTILITYDEQATELNRTILSSGDDQISLIGIGLAATNDGTWIIAGKREHSITLGLGSLGWVAAVDDGEILWTQEFPGSAQSKTPHPLGVFSAASAIDNVFVAGGLGTIDGARRWAMHLSSVDGSPYSEQIGLPTGDDYDSYIAASTSGSGPVWLSGVTHKTGSVKQWMCSVDL